MRNPEKKSHVKVPKKSIEMLSGRERDAWSLPREVTVSEWANEHRILDAKTSAEPGQWRTERTPYLKGIMDAFNDSFVEEITIKASTQIGKTEAMYNMIGYIIDQDPGPTLLVMPRENDAKSVSSNRIRPMIEISSTLRSHLTPILDDMAKLEYNLDRMILYFVGSNSPAALAQRPVRYLFFDEIDKYPRFSGRESDPIRMAAERTRTFWNRKIVKSSTPTTREGYISREYDRSDRSRYYVPCPYCGTYQILLFGQIKWPEEERNPEKIREERIAWYECQECHKHIIDKQKPRMLERGVWAPEGVEITSNGCLKGDIVRNKHRGFWLSALYSPWLTFSEIASEFLASKDYTELLMNFVNSWLAEIWEEKVEETRPDKLLKLACDYDEGTLPLGVLVLTSGVDVQQTHFYIVIRGWGYGEESWLIRACRVESWEEVVAIIFMTNYARENGTNPMGVTVVCIDSGYRTNEVYEVCRKWKDIARATKGHDQLPGMPYRVTHIDRDSKGKPIKAGLGLWHLNTSYYKDKINRMVHADPGDPAQWHLFRDVSDEYRKQFCAEQKIQRRDKKGRTYEEWKLTTAGAKNHYLDCEVGAVAAADMIRVSAMRQDEETTIYRPTKKRGFITKSDQSWIQRKGHRSGGWVRRG